MTLLHTLKAWSEQGWIRSLDSAFAAFMVELCPAAPDAVVLAAALVAHMEGRGHTCLPIDELMHDADAVLGWSALPSAAFDNLMAGLPGRTEDWLDALRASPLVAVDDHPRRPAGVGVDVDVDVDDHPPLVLRARKLYLRRGWEHEQRVAAQVLRRVAVGVPAAAADAADAVDAAAARHWLDRLFPPDPTAGVDWQKVACAIALRAPLSIITGGPGTGKTHTAARLLALLFAVDAAPQRLRVALAAPTGKAAARLRQSITTALQALQPQLDAPGLRDTSSLHDLAARIGPARTLHALLGAHPGTRRFRADAAHPLELDVLIVDEASMIHLEMMAALLAALPARARVVFLGDQDQLASVEAGAVLGDLCRDAAQGRYTPATAAFVAAATGQHLPADCLGHCGGDGPALAQQTVMLRHSHRFGGRIGELARAVNAGDANAAAALLPSASGEPLHWPDLHAPSAVVQLAVQGRPGAPGGYATYLRALHQRPAAGDRATHEAWAVSVLSAFERFRVLCAVHDGEWGTASLNAAIERALVDEGLLRRRGEWYEGRPVMVTRNDAGLGVFNGDIGIALRPFACGSSGEAGTSLRAFFLDGNALRSVGVSRLANVETAFALTVHKSQGSEFEHTVLVLPAAPSRVLTRELVYTGITRARLAFTLATGRRQALAEALVRRTRRSSGLAELLADAMTRG